MDDRDTDEEIMVSDLEYISANVVTDDDAIKPTHNFTLPTHFPSRYNIQLLYSDGTSSSETSDNEEEEKEHVTPVNPRHLSAKKGNTLKSAGDDPQEDGELLSESECNLDPSVAAYFQIVRVFELIS